MAMQTNVKSTHLTASGSISSVRARIKSVSYRGTGTAGYIRFRDGSVTGAILAELDVGPNDTFTIYVILPGEGVLASTSIYAELSNVAAMTTFWG